MTDKELHRLNRRQLLELMLSQSRRIDKLERELAEAKEQLENRRIVAEQSGSIAEAALRLSGVFEAAEEAAALYLESVRQNAVQKREIEFDFENPEF